MTDSRINRQGYGPFLLGVAASAVVLVGKFVIDVQPVIYAGAGFLIVASVWNSAPRRTAVSFSCENRAPSGDEATARSAKEAAL